MARSIRLGSAAVALALFLPAAASERWLHLEVEDGGPDGTRVRIQFPLSAIRAALPHLRAEGLHRGRVRLDPGAVDPDDLARARESFRSAMEGRVVEVGDAEEPLRLERQGEWLVITGAESDRRRIRLQVPVEIAQRVLDALPEEIDLVAVLDSVRGDGDVEIARIEAEGSSVRIWIDAAASAD